MTTLNDLRRICPEKQMIIQSCDSAERLIPTDLLWGIDFFRHINVFMVEATMAGNLLITVDAPSNVVKEWKEYSEEYYNDQSNFI